MTLRTGIGITIGVLFPSVITAQSTWSQYKPGSLAALMEQERGSIVASVRAGYIPLTVTSGNTFPRLAVVQYQDSIRPTSPAHLAVLEAWAKSQQRALDMRTMFAGEALFREDTLHVWIPMQSVLIPHVRQELRRGDRVALYVGYMGAHAVDSVTIDWVFVVNEFTKH